jgi:hypothetical protein
MNVNANDTISHFYNLLTAFIQMALIIGDKLYKALVEINAISVAS